MSAEPFILRPQQGIWRGVDQSKFGERAFLNLTMKHEKAIAHCGEKGKIAIDMFLRGGSFEIVFRPMVGDPRLPYAKKLFDPFRQLGKSNGRASASTIVSKVITIRRRASW